MDSSLCNLNEETEAVISPGSEEAEDDISSLPRGKGWRTEHLYNYQGFWYSMHLLKGVMWAQKHFASRPSDILLASFYKSGTTWLKALTYAIMNRGGTGERDYARALSTKNPHNCIQFVESYAYEDDPASILDSIPSPRLLSTHMPYSSLPKSVVGRQTGCRVVCIIRDPKDVLVSTMCFIGKIRPLERQLISLEEAFELFCKGVSLVGPFWDHVLGYWEASLERPEKVLVVKYEDMKRDTAYQVERLAKFLGNPFSPEEIENGVLQDIIKLCSIESLKEMEVNKSGDYKMGKNSPVLFERSSFFRTGTIGDWKNHLSEDMADGLDRITRQKFEGYDLTF